MLVCYVGNRGKAAADCHVPGHVTGRVLALHTPQIDWSKDFCSCHHEEISEYIPWEVLDIVTYEIVVKGCIDPQAKDTNQTP